ncbi:MAG: hypothetical protein HQL08_06455 [Nitrospirae bacterium]|nr:hypothetical protein [Nitrospirota bacterium]
MIVVQPVFSPEEGMEIAIWSQRYTIIKGELYMKRQDHLFVFFAVALMLCCPASLSYALTLPDTDKSNAESSFSNAILNGSSYSINPEYKGTGLEVSRKTIIPKSLGVVYQYLTADEMNAIQTDNLFGTLKMGGRWVSALSYTDYINWVDKFCAFATSRNQQALIQLPIAQKEYLDAILSHLSSINCNLQGISIDNEPDDLPTVLPNLFPSYTIQNYISDVNDIAPKIRSYLPGVYIVGLDLMSFTVAQGEDPITNWLVPFCNSSAASNVDYISIHYYPFNGAQKEWDTLKLGSIIKGFFSSESPLVPVNCPPLILGEFNTTFQYGEGTVYPGSGGDSIMAALTVPEIFSLDRISALMHYSLTESPPSTLGLYDMTTSSFKPFYNTYKMLSDMNGGKYMEAYSNDSDVMATVFSKNGKYILYLGNYSPFLKRNITVSNGNLSSVYTDSSDTLLETTVSLAPFSLTQVEASFGTQGTIVNRFSYAYRDLRSGDFRTDEVNGEFCSVLADFSEPNLTGEYFIGDNWNQNNKIASGGSFSATNYVSGASVALSKSNNVLNVDCNVSSSMSLYLCGVELPFYSDTSKQNWRNWQSGFAKGIFRISLETDSPGSFLFQLSYVNPEALGWDAHQVELPVNSGRQVINVRVSDFKQAGWGNYMNIYDALKQISSLSIGINGTTSAHFKINSVQICDKL